MTDTLEFKAVMIKRGLTLKKLANLVGISNTTLSYKINNKREFTSSEMEAIREALNLTEDERNRIFFANNVD